jgi:hypothetical protein
VRGGRLRNIRDVWESVGWYFPYREDSSDANADVDGRVVAVMRGSITEPHLRIGFSVNAWQIYRLLQTANLEAIVKISPREGGPIVQ